MPEIRKILVPVDFSDDSAHALEHAVDFAKAFGSELHLLHCYAINVGGVSPYGVVLPESFERDLRSAALQRLTEWCEKVKGEGVAAEQHITPQLPSISIIEKAKELPADLIVMGTRGLTGLKHVVMGSVAERTVRLAPCPVLTVKAGEES